jgi:hypothetical protein
MATLKFRAKDLQKTAAARIQKAVVAQGGTMPKSALDSLLNEPRKIREKDMNATERAFSELAENARVEGTILRWEFEPVSLKIGPNTRYNPDFLLVLPDRHWQFVEIKGHLRDDAAAKFKTCADKYPECSFLMIKKKKGCPGEWEVIYNLPSPYRKEKAPKILDPSGKSKKKQGS